MTILCIFWCFMVFVYDGWPLAVGRWPLSTKSLTNVSLSPTPPLCSGLPCQRCCIAPRLRFVEGVSGLDNCVELWSSRFVLVPALRPRLASLACAHCAHCARRILVHTHAQSAQVRAGQLNLLDQLFVRLGAVVEGQDAPAEAGQDVRTEGDDEPEGELCIGALVAINAKQQSTVKKSREGYVPPGQSPSG